MDMEAIKQNIEAFTRQEKGRLVKERKEMADETPVYDTYQTSVSRQAREGQRTYPRGSSEEVLATAEQVVDGSGQYGGLASKRRAVDDQIKQLQTQGDTRRANLLRDQYMREEFLPAVEVVANTVSPDELLNNKTALARLDEMAISGGRRRMDGYTAAYIRSAYRDVLGQASGESDETVIDGVRSVNSLMDSGEASGARGTARRLKKKIDAGELRASEDDYGLLSRVALG